MSSQTFKIIFYFVTLLIHCGKSFQLPRPCKCNAHKLTHLQFRLFPFRSPLLWESRLIYFPGGTEMFHFPPFASYGYEFTIWWLRFAQSVFPIRKSPVVALVNSLPKLIAVFHVLHRRSSPRHPLSAICNLITKYICTYPFHQGSLINNY